MLRQESGSLQLRDRADLDPKDSQTATSLSAGQLHDLESCRKWRLGFQEDSTSSSKMGGLIFRRMSCYYIPIQPFESGFLNLLSFGALYAQNVGDAISARIGMVGDVSSHNISETRKNCLTAGIRPPVPPENPDYQPILEHRRVVALLPTLKTQSLGMSQPMNSHIISTSSFPRWDVVSTDVRSSCSFLGQEHA